MPPRPRTDAIRFLTLDELGRLLTATRESVRDWALFLLAHGRLTARDLHALTPLFWGQVNPYGRFELDMETRIAALA